jgi:hypothetical protein
MNRFFTVYCSFYKQLFIIIIFLSLSLAFSGFYIPLSISLLPGCYFPLSLQNRQFVNFGSKSTVNSLSLFILQKIVYYYYLSLSLSLLEFYLPLSISLSLVAISLKIIHKIYNQNTQKINPNQNTQKNYSNNQSTHDYNISVFFMLQLFGSQGGSNCFC